MFTKKKVLSFLIGTAERCRPLVIVDEATRCWRFVLIVEIVVGVDVSVRSSATPRFRENCWFRCG